MAVVEDICYNSECEIIVYVSNAGKYLFTSIAYVYNDFTLTIVAMSSTRHMVAFHLQP